ncbi:MAG: DUF427 domain-containing protein [Kofleriaceae bacterium]|nr:DUF427 domain-containing protein [Kofleriaceae bacterium]
MTQAIWNTELIAESDHVVLVENRVYFPPDSILRGRVRPAERPSSYCHWKGDASYFDIVVDGEVNAAAAWVYETPYREASSIAGYFAFWKGVEIEGKPDAESLKDPGGDSLEGRTGYRALCWLLERSRETRLSAAQVEDRINIPPSELAETFAHRCVVPFAKHMGWQLDSGVLTKSPG